MMGTRRGDDNDTTIWQSSSVTPNDVKHVLSFHTNFQHHNIAIRLPTDVGLSANSRDVFCGAASFIFLQFTPADTIQSVLAAITKRMQMHDSDTIITIYKGLTECRGLINLTNLGKLPSAKGFIPGLTTLKSTTFAGTYVRSMSRTQHGCCIRITGI